MYRGQEYNVSLLPKMEIEVVVSDSMADDAIRAAWRARPTFASHPRIAAHARATADC